MVLHTPPVENPRPSNKQIRRLSHHTGHVGRDDYTGFPTGCAGCGKPLLRLREPEISRGLSKHTFSRSPRRVSHSPCLTAGAHRDYYWVSFS